MDVSKFLPGEPSFRVKLCLATLMIMGIIFVSFGLLNYDVSARNNLQNGSFSSNLADWNIGGDAVVAWTTDGYTGDLFLDGIRYAGQGGAVKLQTPPGSNGSTSGSVYQDVYIPDASSHVKISFAWTKGAVGTPEKQVAQINLLRPGKIKPVTVWEDAGVFDNVYTSVYNDVYQRQADWQVVEDLDLSRHITVPGNYQLQLTAQLKNGSGANARAWVMFDEVNLSISAPDREPPVPPTGLTAQDTRRGGGISLRWGPNVESDLDGYNVYRSPNTADSYVKINSAPVTGNSFFDSGLIDNLTYYYKITAVDYAGNESGFSRAVSVTPTLDDIPPATPTGFTVKDPRTGNKLQLSWEPNQETDFAGYIVYRANSSEGRFERVTPEVLTDTTYIDTNVENNVEYFYQLAAIDDVGNKSQPTEIIGGIPTRDITPPDTPRNLRADNPGTGTRLDISWSASNAGDVAGYILYRSITLNGEYRVIAKAVYRTVYADSDVQRDNTYWYKIAAYDSVGNVSDLSAAVAGTALDMIAPDVPGGLNILDPWTGTELLVNWRRNTENDLAGYNLYRSTSAQGSYDKINTELLPGTAFMDTGLEQGQTYYYRVTAVDTTGNESGPSGYMEAKPYIGIAENIYNRNGKLPARLRIELSNSVLFVDQPKNSVKIKTVAEDVYGRPVPVSGTWKYATDFSRFRKLKSVSSGAVEGEFTSTHTGTANIIVEFIPDSPAGSPVRITTQVRALDWNISLDVSGNQTITGGEDITLSATITDHNGVAVTDPGARVAFKVGHPNKVPDALRKRPKVGRYQDDGKALALNSLGIPTGVGRPDSRGRVKGRLVASTVPGKNRVIAVLRYRDPLVPGAPLLEAGISRTKEIDVNPGPASYIGWGPDKLSIKPGKVYQATIHAYDAFGNITDDTGNLKVSVQSPEDGHVNFSLDRGETWIADSDWHPVPLGTRVEFLATKTASKEWRGGYGFLLVRIDRGGARLAAPPGINQVNKPLYIQVK